MPFDILEMDADTVQTLMKACDLLSIARLCMCSKTYQTHIKGNIKLLSDENKKVICNKTWFHCSNAYTTFLLSCPTSLTPFLEAVRGKRDRWDKVKSKFHFGGALKCIDSELKSFRRKRVKLAKEVQELQKQEQRGKRFEQALLCELAEHDLA